MWYLVTACGIRQGSPGSLWETQDPLELRFLTSEPGCLCSNYSFGICTLYDSKQVMKTLCLSSLTCKYEDDGYNKNHMSTCLVEFLWGSDEIIGKKNCRIKWNYRNCRKKVITFFLGEGSAEGEERSLSSWCGASPMTPRWWLEPKSSWTQLTEPPRRSYDYF